MAGCYAREMDDLHRRWLPPEIFADIGIADAALPSPAAIEGIAVHLAVLLGGKDAPRPPPPPGAASYRHRHHCAQVCGLEGRVLVAYGGENNGGCPAAAASWPFLPHSLVQWQVPTNVGNGGDGGVLDQRLATLRPCRGSPPAKRRGGGGGTGVFLPRAELYQTKAAAAKSPAKDGRPPMEQLSKQQQQRDEAATGTKQQRQNEMAAEMAQQQQQNAAAALHACPDLALPQEWTY